MTIRSMTLAAFALTVLAGQAAWAEEYKVHPGETATTCQSGAKSDPVTIEGEREAKVARADQDSVNAAVCVADGSKSAIHVRWKANGYWNSSGTVGTGCAEVVGASKILVRPVTTNFHTVATYYTCVQE